MQTLEHPERTRAEASAHTVRTTVFVDCVDPVRQDLLVLWLKRAGLRMHDGPLTDSRRTQGKGDGGSVLVTDRFGPGREGGATILQRKERRPGLRVVIIGSGEPSESAQLSLARAAGADATFPAQVDREALLRLLSRWQ